MLAATLRWDPYPFILLNLAFSLQAAYAAPLILLAQARQADRDKALSDADANHREALANGASPPEGGRGGWTVSSGGCSGPSCRWTSP